MTQSCGQVLFHEMGLRQASCFLASFLDDDMRLSWMASFAKEANRKKLKYFRRDSLLLVLSQDCDIAASIDSNESAIELVICKKIPKLHPGNEFVNSVRKLHFKFADEFYEANVNHILTIEKSVLLDFFKAESDLELYELDEEYSRSFPIWRSNRYNRTALPDKFIHAFKDIEKEYLPAISTTAIALDQAYSSYLRGLYVSVSPNSESDQYNFKFFGLLRDEVGDSKMSDIQEVIEAMAEELESTCGFIDDSDIYADRSVNTNVSYLTSLVKYNVDYYSLSSGDEDVGPDSV